jgi:hypothetical protein
MAPLAFLLALLLCPSTRAGDARDQALGAASVPFSGDEGSLRQGAARPFDGGSASDTVVAGRDATGGARLAKAAPTERRASAEPPSAIEKKPVGSKLTTGLMLGGSAALGGLQGWFAGGLLGAAAGAGLGLAAAWLFHKGDYGGAFGVTAGAIIGTAFGGPIGGLIGAVVGGVIGHFLGKLFG